MNENDQNSPLTNSTTSLVVFPLVPPISSRNSFPNSYRTDQNPVYLWPIANFTPIFASLRGCPAGSWHKDNRVLHDNDVIDQTIRGSRCDTGSTVTIKLLWSTDCRGWSSTVMGSSTHRSKQFNPRIYIYIYRFNQSSFNQKIHQKLILHQIETKYIKTVLSTEK